MLKYLITLKYLHCIIYIMNIHTNTNTPFKGIRTNEHKKPTKINEHDQEAKQLEFNLNNHLRSKYKSQERVSFILPPNNTKTSSAIETLILKDIEKRKGNTNWNTMSACDKWSKIKAYYVKHNLHINESLSKNLLLSGKLIVVYDKEKKEVSSINTLCTQQC